MMRRLEYVIGHDSLQDEIHDEKHVDHGEMLLRYESSLERTVECTPSVSSSSLSCLSRQRHHPMKSFVSC